MTMPHEWIVPSWPAPARVRSIMTTRDGGTSAGPWAAASGGGMNLGLGSGDDPAVVRANRARLASMLPSAPTWLRQVHGTRVVDAALANADEPIEADAIYSTAEDTVCAIMVADCMPVLFCNRDGTRVAAAHAGWRGLVAGVLEETIRESGLVPQDTMAWIGPAIGPSRFEVGDDVRNAFIAAGVADRNDIETAFIPHAEGKWLADLPSLARMRLAACGVGDVYASGLCTASDARRFYSYRRDGVTGRMAALIWLAS